MRLQIRFHTCALASALLVGSASAATVTWTDWEVVSNDQMNAGGTMGDVGVSVSSTVAMNGPTQTACGVNWWTQPSVSDPAYTGGSISNAPIACEQIALNSATNVTVRFSHAIDELYMALLSVGQPRYTVTYDFDSAFVIDSEGTGFWGNDSTDGVIGEGYSLAMSEFHGVLRFNAPLTSLTFSTAPGEYWHAFTFAMPGDHVLPEPAVLALLGLSLIGLRAMSRH